jgi:hypothetical protein
MPTLRELRERVENVARSSMQQVNSLASRSSNYLQCRISAFNDYVVGKTQSDSNNWSATTSERNLSVTSKRHELK